MVATAAPLLVLATYRTTSPPHHSTTNAQHSIRHHTTLAFGFIITTPEGSKLCTTQSATRAMCEWVLHCIRSQQQQNVWGLVGTWLLCAYASCMAITQRATTTPLASMARVQHHKPGTGLNHALHTPLIPRQFCSRYAPAQPTFKVKAR